MKRFNRVLAGTLILPTIFGALVLWSMGDRDEQTHRVPAAVVNLDKPVTTGQGKNEQVVYAGRLLASGLTSPTRTDTGSLGWELADTEDAQAGLANGDYYAVVTIPRDFSRTLSRMSGDDPTRAGITLQTNDASSAVIGEASKQVAAIATDRLGHTITSTYLQGVSEQTGQLKGRLREAADGAGKLADGTTRLGGGARRLDGGASTLASGLGQLAGGADRLSTGSRRLAAGTTRLHRGTGRLADGLGTLSRRTDPLPRQTRRLADGAAQVSRGVGPYTELVKGWAQVCTTNPTVAATNARLCAGTIRAAGVGGRNADRLASGARRLADGADQLADATPRLTSAIDQAADGASKLDSGTARLSSGAGRLADGAARLADGAGKASTGAGRLADGSDQLADGTGQLSSGSDRLASGLRRGAEAIPTSSKDQAKKQSSVVADPVAASASSLNRAPDSTTLLLPAVLALALWIGTFVTYLVRRAYPDDHLQGAAGGTRIALLGWLPAVLIGVVQAALVLATGLLLGADIESPFGLAVVALVAVGVFAAVNQSFVAAAGQRRGWILSIAFAALQIVSLGGLVPIDTAPTPFRLLNAVLPLARATDAFSQLTLGGEVGSVAGDLVVLLLWGLGTFAVTAYAARRNQKLDLGRLRDLATAAR